MQKQKLNVKQFLSQLTHHPGVYQMLGEEEVVLYVGKAKNLKKRIASYFRNQSVDSKTATLVKQIKDIQVTITRTETEALLLECNLIKKYKPRYNILLRDDKSYPYIFLSYHTFPRIDFYRGGRKKDGRYFGPFPSSMAVRETINLLQKLFKIRTCSEPYFNSRVRPCILHQIDRCTAPCVKLVTQENYQKQVELAVLFLEGKSDHVIEVMQKQMEAFSVALQFETAANIRDQIVRLRNIQHKQYIQVKEGQADVIGLYKEDHLVCLQLLMIRNGQVLGSRAYFPEVPFSSTVEAILSAFITQHYFTHPISKTYAPKEIILNTLPSDQTSIETAFLQQLNRKLTLHSPSRGEKKKWLEMANLSAKQSLHTQLYQQMSVQKKLQGLQDLFHLPYVPQRIECFDISHHMGEATVASCVVFGERGLIKSEYRRFNIKGITPGNDVGAIKQVILRRYQRLENKNELSPDIVFIDGGKGQLQAGSQIMQTLNLSKPLLVGISKGPGRKPGLESLHRLNLPILHLPPDSTVLHLIQHIRDEAHRFAITGHRGQRDKKRRHSALENIPGIGPNRRRELLRHFGGIQGVNHASLEELMKVSGISRSLAYRIFAALHDET